MRRNLIAAAAVALIAGSAALAQETGAGGLSMNWSGPIGQALFTDESMSTARSGEELQTNWQSLGQEQQQQMRAHCQSMQTQMGLGGGDASAGGAAGGTTTGTGAGTDIAGAGATGGATSGAAGVTTEGAGEMAAAGATGGTAGQPGTQQLASLCSEIEGF